MEWMLLLAQAAVEPTAEVAAKPPWWQMLGDFAFAITLAFIFLVAIVTIVVQQRSRDRCLKLFHDYHVSYTNIAGQTMWGDLLVYSQGLELIFSQPYRNRRGVIKSSAMIYQAELPQCLTLCRVDQALTDQERRDRQRQIRKTFQPSVIRRTLRWIRNVFNTLRDAFSKALTMILGQIAKANPTSVINTQKTGVDQIGQTLLGVAANAYEPILERHIGKPVVVTLASPTDPDKTLIELPGYLAEYSDKYVAVFNVEHQARQAIELELSESHQQAGLKVDLTPDQVAITCLGHDALVVESLTTGDQTFNLSVPLTNGNSVRLTRLDQAPVCLKLSLTRRIDLVCPRAQATIHYAGHLEHDHLPDHPSKLAPSEDAESLMVASVQSDT